MDVSLARAAEPRTSDQSDIRCDVCGYSRRGLPGGARCPECGEPPPALVPRNADNTGASPPLQTAADLAWHHGVAAGLVLLVLSSAAALRVTLVLPAPGPLALAALNLPGPKLSVAALLQRSVDGHPGPWGVAGTVAVVGNVVALWLLTQRRSLRGDDGEPAVSLRRSVRWVGTVVAGAMLGVLLGGASFFHDDPETTWFVAAAVLLGELPANALLYAYLRRLASQIGDRRAAAVLDVCVWAVPALCAAAGLMAFEFGFRELAVRPPLALRLLLPAAYGVAALAVGAAATAAVGRLAVTALAAAWRPRGGGRTVLNDLARLARGGVVSIRRDGHRWRVTAGLLLWVALVPATFTAAVSSATRVGLGGNVPAFNFPGPKVSVASLAASVAGRDAYRYYYAPARVEMARAVLLNLAAVWLMTGRAPRGDRDRLAAVLRRGARWAATAAVGVVLGVLLAAAPETTGPTSSRPIAYAVAFAETPATLLVYLHLAECAAGSGALALARMLRRLAAAAAALAVAPLAFFVLAVPLRSWHGSPPVLAAAALLVTAAVATSLLAAGAVARLAITIATANPRLRRSHPECACREVEAGSARPTVRRGNP